MWTVKVAGLGLLTGLALALPGHTQVLTQEQKAGVRSKPGQIFVLLEPHTPLRLQYEGGVCLQVQQNSEEAVWLETTHPKIEAFKAKPPRGWSFGSCDDNGGGK